MPTETRFSEEATWTVNGFLGHKHITVREVLHQWSFNLYALAGVRMYMATRFWVGHADGTTTEIGPATYKAQANAIPRDGIHDQYYGSYIYPDTVVVPTDCLLVRVYCRNTDNNFTLADLAATLVSEQLGAQSLDTNTLTIMYDIIYDSAHFLNELYFGWYSLYGEDFDRWEAYAWKWTPYVPPSVPHQMVGDGLTLVVA